MSRRLVDGKVPDRDRNEEGQAENARPRDRYGRPLPYGEPDQLADREEPEEVVDSVAEALVRARTLFSEQRFFEAHEFLEYVWKSDEVEADDREYWKGVTQVAVGCAHTQRGNDEGARTLLQRAAAYLQPYPSPYGGVDKDALVGGAMNVVAQIDAQGAGPDLAFPSLPLVPDSSAPLSDFNQPETALDPPAGAGTAEATATRQATPPE